MLSRSFHIAYFLLAGWLACAGQAVTQEPPAAPQPEEEQRVLIVPAQTRLSLVVLSAFSSRTAHAGDLVHFETIFPVTVENRIVIPMGSFVEGQVVEARRGGVFRRARLAVQVTRMILPNGYTVVTEAGVSGAPSGSNASLKDDGKFQSKADAKSAARQMALGAGVGLVATSAITLGRGAAMARGAAVGVAIGFLSAVAERGQDVILPRGATVQVILHQPLALDASRVNFAKPGRTSVPLMPYPDPRRASKYRRTYLWP